MRSILSDPILQMSLEEKGYIILKSFLNPAEVEELRKFYQETQSDLGKGFHASSHSHDYAYKKAVHERVSNVFNSYTPGLLNDYVPITSSYTVKEPGEDSFFDFHLDWSMVDEDRFSSITIWCPLEDVNETNGNLWVLEGSHKMGKTWRGGPGLFLLAESSPNGQGFVKKALPLRAGDAVLYDHRLFHGSPPNLSGNTRIAINHAMRPAETASWHFHQKLDGTIDTYEVDDDFYNRYIIGTEPAAVRRLNNFSPNGVYLDQPSVNTLIR